MKQFVGFLAAAIALSCSTSSIASETECISIENDLDRLACYDRVAGRTPRTETEKVETGDWLVRTSKSEFEDTTDVYLSVTSNEPASCGHFSAPEKATLMIRCQENTTSLFLVTNCHLTSGHGGYGEIDYRVDNLPAGDRHFEASTDNRALGLWNGGRSIPFIKKLIGADRLLMRFTPFNESPTTVEFKITGLEEAIEPLRKECGW